MIRVIGRVGCFILDTIMNLLKRKEIAVSPETKAVAVDSYSAWQSIAEHDVIGKK